MPDFVVILKHIAFCELCMTNMNLINQVREYDKMRSHPIKSVTEYETLKREISHKVTRIHDDAKYLA